MGMGAGMSSYWNDLAAYNSERARGIVHTPEMDARMAEKQREFDAASEAALREVQQARAELWGRRRLPWYRRAENWVTRHLFGWEEL